MLFSQRMGLKPIKNLIQSDSMDDDLRNGLWNVLQIKIWGERDYVFDIKEDNVLCTLVKIIWIDYFKLPLYKLDYIWPNTFDTLSKYFFNCKWYEVYDFIEFIAIRYPDNKISKEFTDFCNLILKKELSAYRFVGKKLCKITSEEEIETIENAIHVTDPLKPVQTHLKTALDFFSDRKSPDYRNSIKESISAVEALCCIIAGEKTTLGKVLDIIEAKIKIHPALKKAFSNLYGYTNDADGIRHALLEESDLSYEDAKFMLVSCSVFINYLIEKGSKAGISFEKCPTN